MRARALALVALGIASAATAQSAPASHSVSILAAGDLVPNALAMASIRRAPTEDAGYGAFLGGYADVLASRPDAIAYVNLEVPLVDDLVPLDGGWPRSLPEHPRRAPVLGASPALAPVLAAIGVDVVGLANNHAYDQTCAGLRRTRDAVVAAGIAVAGAGDDPSAALAPVVVDRGGMRVAFVSLTTSTNRTAHDEPRMFVGRDVPEADVVAAIADARGRADVVAVLVHWGRDFQTEADGEMRGLARRLIDAGADVILGTGPHVLLPVERLASPRGEALVAFSLGNVASGMGRAYRLGHPPHGIVHPANALPEGRDGIVLEVGVVREADGTIAIGAVAGTPLWMENDFLDHPDAPTIRAVRLAAAAAEVCAERLPIVRGALGAAVTIDTTCAAR